MAGIRAHRESRGFPVEEVGGGESGEAGPEGTAGGAGVEAIVSTMVRNSSAVR